MQGAGEIEGRIRASISNADESIRHSAQAERWKSRDLYWDLSDFVRAYPLAAVGIAFGAAVAVTSLLRR
ncbi:MAG: hypothetical protein H0V34_13110 [Gammaproteobacteria bacterium]|nr:hypothetical protein [Gammaproteobacteria bacterium]MBA3732284.1 hypothetical protein [Gammaproteobacteria bacterium]